MTTRLFHSSWRRPAERGGLGSRLLLRTVALGVLLALVVGVSAYVLDTRADSACVDSPVAAQALSDLKEFTDWLHTNDVRGYVGEVGWPGRRDAAQWNEVASTWYDAADRDGLWVTAWAAGRWWPRSYPLTIYRLRGTNVPPVLGTQAEVVQEHLRVSGALRGVDLPSGAFGAGPEGAGWYSNTRRGTYDKDYYYDDASDFAQLAAQGVGVVRLSMSWERLQPRLGRPLDPRELTRLGRALDAAQAAGLGVVLDLHNYGDYWVAAPGDSHRRLTLGSAELPASYLADFWRRVSLALKTHTSVVGLGLMNEPTQLSASTTVGARRWEVASQLVVDTLRAAGDQHTLFVAGYGGASPSRWASVHPRAWIHDPLDQIRYEAHQYFDADRTGHYSRSFSEETDRARASGFTTTCSATPHPASR